MERPSPSWMAGRSPHCAPPPRSAVATRGAGAGEFLGARHGGSRRTGAASPRCGSSRSVPSRKCASQAAPKNRRPAFAEHARRKYPHLTVSSGIDIRAAVADADIVCTVTNLAHAGIAGRLDRKGARTSTSVGASVPSKREIDDEMVLRAKVFADYRRSTFAQAGEIVDMIRAGTNRRGTCRGGNRRGVETAPRRGAPMMRASRSNRSLGIAAQDIACAYHCWEQQS